jgi:hypothetical protein
MIICKNRPRPAASLSGPGKWIGGPTDQTRSQVNVERLQPLLVMFGCHFCESLRPNPFEVVLGVGKRPLFQLLMRTRTRTDIELEVKKIDAELPHKTIQYRFRVPRWVYAQSVATTVRTNLLRFSGKSSSFFKIKTIDCGQSLDLSDSCRTKHALRHDA